MDTLAISKFKARCLSILEQVRQTKKPLLVTKFGKPVAQILPPPPMEGSKDWLGCMKGTVTYLGDIMSPASDPDEWEVLRD